MTWTAEKAKRLAELEAEFEYAGGRGVDLAEEIDALRAEQEESWPDACPTCGRNPALERPPDGQNCHERPTPAGTVES